MSRRFFFSVWSVIAAVLPLLLLPPRAMAKYIGADPPRRACSCSCACNAPVGQDSSAAGTSISRTEGNLSERVDLTGISGGTGAVIPFTAVYNSYNADNSRAQVDTIMGYGWTHTYNIFLFDQLGAMFRYDGDGRVTRFGLGPNGGYVAQLGDFETLVKNSDGSFTLTQKDQTVYSFAVIPNTPFLVAGPVWQLTSIVDRNGNHTTFAYNASGTLSSITNAYGRSLTFTYTAQNKLSTVTDPAGRVTMFQYDSTGHKLTTIIDATGKTIQYSYNFLYQLTAKTDRAGQTFTYTYNSAFEPTAVKDSAGSAPATLSNPTNWGTNAISLAMNQMRVYTPSTTTNTDGRGNVWKYQYDSNGYINVITAPDSTLTKYTYDPATLMPSSMTDGNGNATSYMYDSEGNTTTVTDALGHVTSYTYEATFNMMTSMTDARGRVTSYSYDAHGNRIQETDPLGQTRKWTYDAHGNVLTERDKNGNTTQYQYDSFGNRTQVTDPVGNISTMSYDAVGNVLSSTDALGRVTSYQYDGMNRVIQQTDATSHTIQTQYDGDGNRTKATDQNGHSTSYGYDLRLRLIVTTDAVGKTETYQYDANDNRTSLTDRNSHTTGYAYDLQNRLAQVTDALGHTTKTAYDAVGNVTSQTDANGHTTTITYDQLNRRSTVTDAAADITRYFYDTGTFGGTVNGITCIQCGVTPGSAQVTEQIDPDGNSGAHAGVTYYKFDALDRLIIQVQKTGCIGAACPDTITSADAVTSTIYDPVGNRTSFTEPNGNTTTDLYDADNRRTQDTNAAGDVTRWTYDPVSNIATITSPNLNVTTNNYDALNRLTQVTDSVGLAATYTYDPVGNRTSRGDGNGNITTSSYDSLNRLMNMTDSLGKATAYQYDPVGNLLSITDRNGNVTTYVYDAINRRLSTTDALGNATQNSYDPVGNTLAITDANGHTTQYAYDPVNRPGKETYADGRSRQFSYDALGNVISRTDQIGQTTVYSYSDLYFLTGRTYPSAVNDSFTYDLSGRVLSAQHGTWPESFTYDGADRILQTVQNGHTVQYSYNIPGRTRTMAYPGGRTITEHTDARTRLDHIDDVSTPPSIVQYTYDLGDRPINRLYRNGATTSYTYNANNWATNLQHAHGSTPIAGFQYAYDNEGNKQFEQKLQDTTHSEAYQYDSTYRLINYAVGTLVGSTVPVPITQTSYSLDPVGNWNSKTTNSMTQNRTHDAVNQLIQMGSTMLTYDADGNSSNDGTYLYSYDEENRLTQVTKLSDSVVIGQYQYDSFSRRVQKIADPAGTSSTTVYFYDYSRVIEEQDGGGVTQATYVYGNYVDDALTMTRGSQTYYYHQNALGSVEALTDGTGTVVERYSYDAYGSVTVADSSGTPLPPNSWGTPHSAIGNPWMFTGRQLDEESGLYYYRARTYDPVKGRFLQRDPIEYLDSMNLYEYALDNPLRFVDPMGTEAGPYANMSQQELMKLYDQLASRWAALDTLSRLDPQGEFARKYNITAAQIKDAQNKLKQMKDLQQELDRRRAAQNCPKQNPCQIFWEIMAIAGEFDVVNSAIQAIEAVGTIGTLGASLAAKPGTEGGKKLTKQAIIQGIKDYLKKKYQELPEIANLAAGRALLNNILDPQKACAALAECETKLNGRGGFWQRTNFIGRAIRTCAWNNTTATWYKSGLQIGDWAGSVPVIGGLFGRDISWQIEK